MKKPLPPAVVEFPEGCNPYVWVRDRVPGCSSAACRRARRCVRPRKIEGRWPYGWRSCPLLTNEEWIPWAKETMECIRQRIWAREEAKLAAQQEAEREAKRRRR